MDPGESVDNWSRAGDIGMSDGDDILLEWRNACRVKRDGHPFNCSFHSGCDVIVNVDNCGSRKRVFSPRANNNFDSRFDPPYIFSILHFFLIDRPITGSGKTKISSAENATTRGARVPTRYTSCLRFFSPTRVH